MPILQLLQAKKQKDILMIGLTRLQLLLLYYNFYKQKNKNRYLQLACYTYSCYPHITIFMSRKAKTGICNWPDIAAAAISMLQFL